MKLNYHEGKNVGDALNPYIFYKLFPLNFFDGDNTIQFLGIGTILGLKKEKGKKIVFSSGVSVGQADTYGDLPTIDENYDVYCVRGPLTADVLKLPLKKAVCDGAYLLREVYDFDKAKQFKVAYIPHHKSESFSSDFENICKSLDIEYISPQLDVEFFLDKISKSDYVITEAMHGAIIADAFRIPWVPVKSFPFIDDFKWRDFTLSMDIKDFKFNYLSSLHNAEFYKKIIKLKTKNILPNFFDEHLSVIFCAYYRRKFKKELLKLRLSNQTYLSEEKLMNDKIKILLDLVKQIILKYDE